MKRASSMSKRQNEKSWSATVSTLRGPAGEVAGAGVGFVVGGNGGGAAHERQPRARLGIGDGGVVADEQAGPRIGAQVVGVGGERREQQERGARRPTARTA